MMSRLTHKLPAPRFARLAIRALATALALLIVPVIAPRAHAASWDRQSPNDPDYLARSAQSSDFHFFPPDRGTGELSWIGPSHRLPPERNNLPVGGPDSRCYTVADKYQVLYCPSQVWSRFIAQISRRDTESMYASIDVTGYFVIPTRGGGNLPLGMDSNAGYAWWLGSVDVRKGGRDRPTISRVNLIDGWWCTQGFAYQEAGRFSGLPDRGHFMFEDGHVAWLNDELIVVGVAGLEQLLFSVEHD